MADKPTPLKIPDLNSLPRGAISIKGLPLSRNSRLPSIRSPRDLTLGAQPKRVFTPNIPVRREKKNSVPNVEKSKPIPPASEFKAEKKFQMFSKNKQRQRNIIQTEGSIFGDGLTPSTSKNHVDRQRESVPRFTPKRPIVKKEFEVSDMENGINELLRDDFIDDDEDDDDDEVDDLKPIIYPCPNNAEKVVKKEETNEQSFEKDFAKEMGFDVNKIARYIKKEKGIEESPKVIPKIDVPPDSQNELLNLFQSGDTQLFILEFPRNCNVMLPDDPQRDLSNEEPDLKEKQDLSSLPEGSIGKLQFMKSGRVRLAVGENYFYLTKSNSLKSKQEVVSIRTDEGNNDMIVLGNVDPKLIVTPDVNKLLGLPR